MKPIISVIMVAYNAERYLKESLGSVVSQSFKDIEIIFVDDGSSDSTLDIVREFSSTDPRIKILSCPHEGAGAGRNRGIEEAQGEYLSILDADDLFDAEMLEKSYSLATREQADIVIFKFRLKDTVTGEISHDRDYSLPPEYIKKNAAVGTRGLPWSNPAAWNKLFRREFIKQSGLRFQNLRSCNDFAFTKSAFIVAKRIFFLDEELLTYQVNPHNISSTRYLHAENIISAGKAVLDFIRTHSPSSDLGVFYEMMFEHCKSEYNLFPPGADTKKFTAAVNSFLPWKYRYKFFKLRFRRFKKHLRSLLTSKH